MDHPVAIDVNGSAVGWTLILEIEHLFPDAIAVLVRWFIEWFFLEDASLHFIEQLFFGHGFGEVFELLKVELSLG